MVLVDPEFRRQGVASNLVRQALRYLEDQACSCQKLDATEEGRGLYQRLGFRVEYEVQRWKRFPGQPLVKDLGGNQPVPLEASLPPGLMRLDRRIFGASRRQLLESFLVNAFPGYQGRDSRSRRGSVPGQNELQGYGFVRPGRKAAQVGPLVALSLPVAEQLMERLLQHFPERETIADVVAGNGKARALLERHDFLPVRHLVRMFRGRNVFAGRPEVVYCLAGFEWG
jgi:GNAT superfamily N-acetyltransferase